MLCHAEGQQWKKANLRLPITPPPSYTRFNPAMLQLPITIPLPGLILSINTTSLGALNTFFETSSYAPRKKFWGGGVPPPFFILDKKIFLKIYLWGGIYFLRIITVN